MRQEQVTRPLADKKVDDFHVSFYGMDENLANVLGRQVLRLGRPAVYFQSSMLHNKGKQTYDVATIQWQPVDIEFADDSSSLVTYALYKQIKDQVQNQSVNKDSFEINVKVYGTGEEVVEEFTLKQCVIEGLQHSEAVVTESSDNRITITVRFMDVDYRFPKAEASL